MTEQSFTASLLHLCQARQPYIFVRTVEEQRLAQVVAGTLRRINGKYPQYSAPLLTHDAVNALVEYATAKSVTGPSASMPGLLDFIRKAVEGGSMAFQMILCLDLASQLRDAQVLRRLKNMAVLLSSKHVHLIAPYSGAAIPDDFKHMVSTMELGLPGPAALKNLCAGVYGNVYKQYKDALGDAMVRPDQLADGVMDDLVDAVAGMTAAETAAVVRLGLVSTGGKLDGRMIAEARKAKCAIVQGLGLLQIEQPSFGFELVGGLNAIKDYVLRQKTCMSPEARAAGIPAPKGMLLTGIPGVGKSYISKAIAMELGRPLVVWDISSMLTKLVGDTEKNVRAVLGQVNALGKVVLRIDEIDKFFSENAVANESSGVVGRVLAYILEWLQEGNHGAYVVATSNNHDVLPAPLKRAGRFDSVWFLDLPSSEARKSIFEACLRQLKLDPSTFDTKVLANKTNNWTGAEIYTLIAETMSAVWAAQQRKITTEDLVGMAGRQIIQYETDRESIIKIRETSALFRDSERYGIHI